MGFYVINADLFSIRKNCYILFCFSGVFKLVTSGNNYPIVYYRSSFSGWKYSVKDWLMSDVDYFSFLFSTLTGKDIHLPK